MGYKLETGPIFQMIQDALRSKLNPAILNNTAKIEDGDIPVFTGDFGKLGGGATIKFAEEIGITYKDGVPYFNALKATQQGKASADLLSTTAWIAQDGKTVPLQTKTYKSMPLEAFPLKK